MNGDRAWPESLDVKAEFRQQRASVLDALDIGLFHFDDRGNEQRLARHVFARARGLQAFIHKTLMRRMLIDNDESIAGLSDDISCRESAPARRRAAHRDPPARAAPHGRGCRR